MQHLPNVPRDELAYAAVQGSVTDDFRFPIEKCELG